jgi:hypothetical protein
MMTATMQTEGDRDNGDNQDIDQDTEVCFRCSTEHLPTKRAIDSCYTFTLQGGGARLIAENLGR